LLQQMAARGLLHTYGAVFHLQLGLQRRCILSKRCELALQALLLRSHLLLQQR
jgi:hypothetical protein